MTGPRAPTFGMLCGSVPMWVGTRLLTFGNQAEDVENVPIGIYQIVSKLLGRLVLGALFFFGVATALVQGASGREARGLRLRNELRTPTGPTVAPDFSKLIFVSILS